MIPVSADHARWARRAAGLMLLLAGGSALGSRAGFAADAAYGRYLAAECAACHRPEPTNGAIPPLRLLPCDRLVAELAEYRDGARADAAMQAVARSLGGAEVEALAAYLCGRP